MKKLIFLLLSTLSLNVLAANGFIVKNAVVTQLSSTSLNEEAFWLWYETSSNDPCAGKIKFRAENAGTEDIFVRSFSLATTALVTGKKISVYSYTDPTDCFSAVSINLSR